VTAPGVLTDADRRVLLDVAADVIRDALTHRGQHVPDPADFDAPLSDPGAAFVTLEREEQLLGCIGSLVPVEALVVDVARHALAAAFADPRLPAVTRDDFEAMSIKVSVLSPTEPIAAASFRDLGAVVRPGVDGLLVESGRRRATLLPSVWRHVENVEEFLGVLWQKAGLAPGTWPPGTVAARYGAEEFGDPGPRSPAVAASP
jgi:AmmeMemoRadiSam system protein A